jgi:2-haloacid dehalogenase
MSIDRRGFLAASVGALVGGRAVAASEAKARAPKRIKAVLFDALALFDPRVAMTLAERLYPEKAALFVQAWRTRQFEYQWLRVLGGRYVDFLKATEDGMRFAARQTGVALSNDARRQLMSAYTNLQVWPDAQQVLPSIRDLGVSLGILSNMTPDALESGLTRADLRSLFSHVLSADRVCAPKPAPSAYRLGVDSLRLERDEVLFVAFAGWDVAGAAWFGYPTYWLNRLGAVPEELGVVPQGTGSDLYSLLSFLQAQPV